MGVESTRRFANSGSHCSTLSSRPRCPASTRRNAATEVIDLGHRLDPHDRVVPHRLAADRGRSNGDQFDVTSRRQ